VLLRDVLRELNYDNFCIPDELEEEISEDDMISYIILKLLKRFAKKGDKVKI
jgi:hypothetical protein